MILSPRIRILHNAIQNDQSAVLPEFWHELEAQGAPIIESSSEDHSLVTFVWRDDGLARHVAVIQDWGADGIRDQQMTRLPGSDV